MALALINHKMTLEQYAKHYIESLPTSMWAWEVIHLLFEMHPNFEWKTSIDSLPKLFQVQVKTSVNAINLLYAKSILEDF